MNPPSEPIEPIEPIEIAIDVAAPPSRVFEALTRASELERWFTEKAPNGRRTATRLTLVHSGFGERDTEDFRTGWLKHVSWMKALLERGNSWVAPSNLGAGCDA